LRKTGAGARVVRIHSKRKAVRRFRFGEIAAFERNVTLVYARIDDPMLDAARAPRHSENGGRQAEPAEIF
jgi:hypothetical protein